MPEHDIAWADGAFGAPAAELVEAEDGPAVVVPDDEDEDWPGDGEDDGY